MAAISFARGAPAPECLDQALIADCARAALERDGITILSYGTGGGYGPLRELLAERHGVETGQVFLTTGGLQGFVFYTAVQLAQRPGRVLVEGPTYDRPLKILAREGAEVVPLAMDDEGLDLDALEAELRVGGDISFLYTIPTFQNPSGRTIGLDTAAPASRARRRARSAHPGGRSLWARPLRGRAASLAPRDRRRRAGHVHLVVLEDGRTRPADRLLRRPAAARRRLRRPRRLDLHLAEPAPSGDGARAHAPRRRSSRTSMRIRGLLKARKDAMLAALEAEMPAGTTLEHAGGWVLPLARLRRRRRCRRAPDPGDRGRCDLRPRLGLLPERLGRAVVGPPGVQLRIACANRRRRRAPRVPAVDRRGRAAIALRVVAAASAAVAQVVEEPAGDEAEGDREQQDDEQRGLGLEEHEVDRDLLRFASTTTTR